MTTPANVRIHNPPKLAAPRGYSHVAEVTGGKLVFIAGQIALDPAGKVVGPGDLRAQTVQVFENLKAALEAAGATFDSLLKLNIYLTDITGLPVVREVRDKYLNTKNPPASTAVGVTGLAMPELLVEIEAVAVVTEAFRKL